MKDCLLWYCGVFCGVTIDALYIGAYGKILIGTVIAGTLYFYWRTFK